MEPSWFDTRLTERFGDQAIIYYHSLRRGPTGSSSLAPATQDKMHPFIIIQWSWFVQL